MGQAQDYTAICVVEAARSEEKRTLADLAPDLRVQRERENGFYSPPVGFQVRHLERLALGTTYPRVTERVAEIVGRLPSGGWLLAVDATGVGAGVVDILEQAALQPIAITITGGDSVQGEGRRWRVPKRDLVAVLTVALQAGRLKIAEALPLAGVLARELLSFKVKIDARTANDSYGAWRDGEHDDLVLAAALACWQADRSCKNSLFSGYYAPIVVGTFRSRWQIG